MKKALCITISVLMTIFTFCTGINAKNVFDDVYDSEWYSNYINDCSEKGYMEGTGDRDFEPEATMSRAMFIKTLYSFYKKNIEGTEKDLTHLGNEIGYSAGLVATDTEIDCTNSFTLEQISTVWSDPSDPSSAAEVIERATRDELVSGSIKSGFYAEDITNQNGKVHFLSFSKLSLVPDSAKENCDIFMKGGSCFGSGFKGCANRVTVSSDKARIEAETEYGSEFEIKLCDLGSRTCAVVKGKSSGNITAELFGYDLSVKGAIADYTVLVYEWVWKTQGDVLKIYNCSEGQEESNVLPFKDIEEGSYYIDALNWASLYKVTAGVSKNEFDPDSPIIREQAAVILKKFISEYDIYSMDPIREFIFVDWMDVSDYAKRAVEFVSNYSMMVGDNFGKFNPKSNIRRCEMAAIISKIDNVINK